MEALNRQERQTLRRIQSYLQTALLDMQVVVEQLGTVDVYFHPTNPDPFLNCATPHKGVAWVRRDDLNGAFIGLERLGRDPRLTFQDALFPAAFQQQLKLMGLYLENVRMVMVYQPICGPVPNDEILFGCLPGSFNPDVQITVATDAAMLGAWLRVFRAGYFNTDALAVEPEMVQALVRAVDSGRNLFVLSHYQGTPLGAARIGIRNTTAELEAVVTTPLWYGMGLEDAMIATAVREVETHGCNTIFTIQPPEEYMRVFRRLGFEELTRVLTYRLAPNAEPAI